MVEDELLNAAYDALLEMKSDKAKAAVEDCLKNGIAGTTILKTLGDAMLEVGRRFDARKLFLPQVVISGRIMDESSKIIFESLEGSDADAIGEAGTIVIGTIEGDIHDLGKNIVATMLKTSGFNVIDLGKDIPAKKFIEAAKERNANIIACSALMSSTMPFLRDVVELSDSDKFKILVGGAPVSQKYAEEIGADAYAEDALDAINVARELVAA
ncbi:cobalamin B12-binding domain-containing protein [Methanococcoides sp. FTZ1]|uniref:cobalamin B12-binding domain-containing protein n=1 Tax=Methanococcoides sp. FTZ1 TaxID=3439061 RepID=UPI003F87AEE7